jgi:ribosome-associated protein
MDYPVSMRGRDEETGEFLSPSRSANRRAALDVLELAETLVGLSAAQLARLPIPDEVMPHIRETQRITSYGARKRQIAFLAKQMRRQDDDALDAIRDAMSKDGETARKETAALHRVEALRDALLGLDGDAAMTELLADHPHADRQKLRQLVRNAHEGLVRAVSAATVGQLEIRGTPAPPRLAIARGLVPKAPGIDQPGEKIEEDCVVLQPAVPPTVRPSILSVGWPTPTGTLWPSLPQVPTPGSSAMSLPIIDTRVSASGPLPISVAPFTGRVTLPSSIR